MSQQSFEDQKAKLNPEQRRAVETIEGPVMVLAGPGTGKTQVLAFRIAEILQQTDVNPRNILALTFTESGVVAMRERLANLIGATAYGVAVYTFHGFANRVINESGAEFYKSRDLEQIDDIRQFKLIARLLDSGEYPELRPARAPYFYVKSVLSTIKNLKSEAVTPDILRERVNDTITSLQDDPKSISASGKSKGELKQTVKNKIEQLTRTLRLADVYEAYQTELDATGRYDYEDMILFVVDKFRENPDLLADYQERFLYVLVDEYQDTNNGQNQLVRLLGQSVESPNIFVVGDDKQSIYRFQGASMANILNFRAWYPESAIVTLKENYRSGQPILDASHQLIVQNAGQLTHVLPELDPKLHAQTDKAVIELVPYSSPDQELLGLAESVRKLLASGVPAAEIAIIYRENREAESVADIFSRQGIGFVLESGDDVLRDRDVQQLINILRVAENPDDDQSLFRYLHAPFSGIPTGDLLVLSRWFRTSEGKLYEAVCKSEAPEGLDLTWQAFEDVCSKIQDWYRYSRHHNIADTVEYILASSGLLPWIMLQPDHLERLHRLRAFFEDVKRLSADEAESGLNDLFERINIRQTYRLPLIAQPVIETGDGAIRLMTAHKSKGLEFAHVFIPNFLDGHWSNTKSKKIISLPDGLVSYHQVTEEEDLEEERRLFYVALTRAKSHISISFSEYDSENKKQVVSQFLHEIGEVVKVTPPKLTVMTDSFFSPVEQNFKESKSREQLLSIVQDQPLSPTSLNTFLQCPMEYLYKHVYKIPGVREADQAYGVAIHRALEEWGKWSKAGDTYHKADVLRIFHTSLNEQGLLKSERQRFNDLGDKVLNAYYDQFCASWVAPMAVEYSFGPHKVLLDGKTPITGKLDKIEPIAGSRNVRIVDYKTGRVRSRNDIEGLTASSDGDYKRQLIFYAILAESDPFFPYKIGEVCLVFVDDDCKFTSETFIITPEEKKEVKALMHSIYDEIIQLHFDHTPHKKRFGQGESLCDLLRV